MIDIDTVLISMGGEGSRIVSDLKRRGLRASKTLIPIQGKSLLERLIDIYLELNFKNIYLLASYYEDDLARFIAAKFEGKQEIISIYGGASGREWGVPWHIYQLSDKLPQNFIYSDGNILYEPSIVKDISASKTMSGAQALVIVSPKDVAPTHSALAVSGNKILNIDVRVSKFSDTSSQTDENHYYSLGLMTLRKSVIEDVKGFSTKKDLDIVIKDLYKLDHNNVSAKIYTGEWRAIHTIQDFDDLANSYKI